MGVGSNIIITTGVQTFSLHERPHSTKLVNIIDPPLSCSAVRQAELASECLFVSEDWGFFLARMGPMILYHDEC